MTAIPKSPGTYLLLMELLGRRNIPIGPIQMFSFKPGLYVYAGSAQGPGGLHARLMRHASTRKRKRWHIDYLLEWARLRGALIIEGRRRWECIWASWVLQTGRTCVEGFGASDCRCKGHLFYMGFSLDDTGFIQKACRYLGAHYVKNEAF